MKALESPIGEMVDALAMMQARIRTMTDDAKRLEQYILSDAAEANLKGPIDGEYFTADIHHAMNGVRALKIRRKE